MAACVKGGKVNRYRAVKAWADQHGNAALSGSGTGMDAKGKEDKWMYPALLPLCASRFLRQVLGPQAFPVPPSHGT
jgi:hypothetical protein